MTDSRGCFKLKYMTVLCFNIFIEKYLINIIFNESVCIIIFQTVPTLIFAGVF